MTMTNCGKIWKISASTFWINNKIAFQKWETLPENGALSRLCDSVVLLVKRNNLGQPKISYFNQWLTSHKDISGCKVSVHISQRLQVLHSLKNHKL